MKRNYLFIVAILFVVCMTFVLTSTHVFDERKKTPASAPQKVERILPKLPRFSKGRER